MSSKSDIIFEVIDGRDGNLGLITLNKPEKLNALNQEMFLALDTQLAAWETDERIKAVIVTAVEGRAFCAGGDIRSAYIRGKEKDPTLPEFFGDEYRMNLRIYHYPKPYIALMNGITMGGGVGISIHGSYRVGTENLVFAMPETGIGFYPDIGASYFLPRMPGKVGFYLGLTGERITYSDCVAVGVVDQIVDQHSFPDIIKKLAETSLLKHADAAIAEVVKYFVKPIEKSALLSHQTEVDTCFSKNTVEEILLALRQYPSGWTDQAANILSSRSPTSLKITLRQLQLGSKMRFDDCMRMEYDMTCHFLKSHDFYEGIRAAIIEKDQKPVWEPGRLEDVSEKDVERYFERVADVARKY
jgi:enoyl-CoA hydratase